MTIHAAKTNGGFVLPTAPLLHAIELRGWHVPTSATMGGAPMKCLTVASPGTLARPTGTVICTGPASASYGLNQQVDVVLSFST